MDTFLGVTKVKTAVSAVFDLFG